jgi:putative ABC transport system permease protein
LVVFGLIALIVAAIGMFNTLTITLLERTREIGILKALGITDKAIRRLFLTESAMIGLLGGIAGILLGLLTDLIISRIFGALASIYQGGNVQLFQYPHYFLLSMVLYPTLLALVTGLYPANRAAKLSSLDALRYE